MGYRFRAIALAGVLITGCAGTESEVAQSRPAETLFVGAWGDHGVASVCLEGAENHSGAAASHTPVMDAVRRSFDDEGDDEVAARITGDGCDVTIIFDISGQPLSRNYNVGVAGRFYTGADVTGVITLSAEGQSPLSATISDRIDPPESFTLPEWKEPPSSPTEAPLWRAVEDGVCAAFSEWFDGTDLTALLMKVRGSWPPRGEECGGYGESQFPWDDLES